MSNRPVKSRLATSIGRPGQRRRKRTAAFADPSGHVWEVAQELRWTAAARLKRLQILGVATRGSIGCGRIRRLLPR
ncbi:hypothetical protein GFL58_11790 [Rhizobium leguminosarum bv. viciae]|nr:hypothetical protein [Rhizobium leguminosarum bv. viciae]